MAATDTITTDAIIVGAGPVGLFAVFELGLVDISAHLIDVLDAPGGQCSELYPEKPIYDIPALPKVSGQGLTDRLMAQIAPFDPVFHLGHVVDTLKRVDDTRWQVTTDRGLTLQAPVVIIAAGGGRFTPKKPPLKNIDRYEGNSVFYAVRDRDRIADKRVVIAGGGDSALDWTNDLLPIAQSMTLVHRRPNFRAAPHSVSQVKKDAAEDRLALMTGQVCELHGTGDTLEAVSIKLKESGEVKKIPCDIFMPFFGLTMRLGPVADWGLNLERNQIVVNTENFETSEEGIFAIGDICTYPGKLKLILSGFHEAALMSQKAFSYIYPDKKLRFQYTTASSSLQKKLGVRE